MRPMPDGQLSKPAIPRQESSARRGGWRAAFVAIVTFLAVFAFAPVLEAQIYPNVAPDGSVIPAAAVTPPSAVVPASTFTPATAVAPMATPTVVATKSASASAEGTSSNRFLFVVDTSKPMARHAQDILDVVETILRSSASGQLHNGDSIGVWTFNEDVTAGNMPLQIWSADDSEEITLRIAEFLREQEYGKKSRLDRAMVPVDKVFKASDIITAFIISSGAGPMHGTPYDDGINAQYLQCMHDMGKNPMPLVTVLQGKHGRIIRYTVNALPWPVVIPELPIPIKLTAEPPAAAPAPASVAEAVATNAAVTAEQPAAEPAVPHYAYTPPAAVTPPAVVPVPVPAVEPRTRTPFSPPAVAMAAPPAPTPRAAPPAFPAPRVPPTVSENANPVASPAAVPGIPPRPALNAQLPLVPARQPPLVSRTLPVTGVMAEETPTAPAAPRAPGRALAITPPAPAPVAETAAAAPAAPPQKTLVVQATALIKSFTGNHRSLLLIGGISLLVLATVLIFLFARHSRPSGRVSLITQTMDDRRR